MPTKFSQSVNIVRDEGDDFGYIVTPNAERVALEIFEGERKGVHSFQLIGSYGTGKSAFLLALTNTLKGRAQHFPLKRKERAPEVLGFVGEYGSFIDFMAANLGVKNDLAGNQRILDALHARYEEAGRLYLFLDEFGKFLEYAAKHNAEREMTFIQQLAEFANKPGRKITLVVTLHQSFEGYGSPTQRVEWRKVQGRFKELTFNEPIAQLVHLAAQQLSRRGLTIPKSVEVGAFAQLAKKHKLFEDHDEAWSADELRKLFPLDIIATHALTKGLQAYGQNERSLFSFLHAGNITPRKGAKVFGLPLVFDHLNSEFYSFLHGPYNPHRRQWEMIWHALERVDAEFDKERSAYSDVVKTIGLLQLFGSQAASIDDAFLSEYLVRYSDDEQVAERLRDLAGKRIFRFVKHRRSYKLQEGTDLDFDSALLKAAAQVDEIEDVVPRLTQYFKHSFVTAKQATYVTGAPRVFAYRISRTPISDIPKGEVDGYINLIFNDKLSFQQIRKASEDTEEAILFGRFRDADKIRETLLDIERTKHVMEANVEDRVAVKELKNILQHQEQLLDHYIHEALYSDAVQWVYAGQVENGVNNARRFNQLLSKVILDAYPDTPHFRNELINREKVSASASTARRVLFDRLTIAWEQEDLGFSSKEYPAERALYATLLKENGIHRVGKNGFDLFAPQRGSTFQAVWAACEAFLVESRRGRKDISELMDRLSERPFKLKYGLVELLVPLFLFVRRGDFALYQNNTFVPQLNGSIMYLMNRRPQDYQVKAFDMDGVRVKLFNKYKAFLGKNEVQHLSNGELLDVVKPFLSFYRNLKDYAQHTDQLSERTKALREAIKNATDPERTFFEDFPAALKLTLEDVNDSEAQLGEFIGFLSESIDELQQAYPRLVDRIDAYLGDVVLGNGQRFPDTRIALAERLKGIKEHQLLDHLSPLYKRTLVPLDATDSFIDSITQGTLNKPLHRITDREEDVLKERLLATYRELDNLATVHREEIDPVKEPVVRMQITTSASGTRTETIRYPAKQRAKVEKLVKDIGTKLDQEPELAKAVLAWLMNERLKQE